MKKLILINILFFIFIFSVRSQTVLIKDAETNKRVADVALYNKEKTVSVYSNKNGEANLDKFLSDENIYLQHPSYEDTVYSKKDLESKQWQIVLKKQVIEIDEFVISAYRWEQKANEVPNKIMRIDQKEIKFNNPQTAADLLSGTNEVFIQKSQLGGGSPMIRGFSTNTVLLVVDGVRMNNAIYREGNLQNVISLDANAIESSEVIFGPGSVTYGSDALGGVMDFHTLKVKLSTSEEKQFSGNAFGRFSSANQEKTAHLDFNVGYQKWGFLTSATYSSFDDLRMGSDSHSEYVRKQYIERVNGLDSTFTNPDPNIQVNTGYEQINLMQKIRFRPSEKIDFVYSFHYSRLSNVPRYDRLVQYSGNELKYAEWYYGPQKWIMNSLNVNYTDSNALFDRSKLTFAFQDYEESRHDRKYRDASLRSRKEQVKAYTLNIDFDKSLKNNYQLFYGIEGVFNTVNSVGEMENIEAGMISNASSRYPDGDNYYTTIAAYVGAKGELSKNLILISGLRANYVSIYSTLEDTTFFKFPYNSISLNNSAINGSVGLVFNPNKKLKMNLNLSSGFHAPNIDDMAKIFDSEPGNVVVPNENLKPEYAYNIDLGMEVKLGDFGQYSITGFYTFLTNAFVRRDFTFNGMDSIMYDGQMSNVLAVVNADRAQLYGLSSSINIDLTSSLAFNAVVNYTKGEDQSGVPLRHVAPLFGTASVSYTKNKLTAKLFTNYNGQINFENLAPSEQAKPYIYATDKNGNPYSPAWWTLNFMTSYEIKHVGTLNLGIENLFDKRYRPYSSGIVAPGLNLIVGLRVKF